MSPYILWKDKQFLILQERKVKTIITDGVYKVFVSFHYRNINSKESKRLSPLVSYLER